MIKKEFEFSFEKLVVWQQSIEFVRKVYAYMENFPKTELYGLTSQIKRSIVSIPANIAEGSTRKSLKDQARFTEIAFGSLIEALNHLIIAEKLNYLSKEILTELRVDIENLSRQINALKNSQINRQKL